MIVSMFVNGRKMSREVSPDTLLLNFLRDAGMKSVKCGCETEGCGLCTVLLDGKPVLSCGVMAARAEGHSVTTLEGVQKEAELLGGFLAEQGAEQCGFCNPGLLMMEIALLREDPDPSEEKIRRALEGNLCRCSGYEGQLRAIKAYIAWRKGRPEHALPKLHLTDESGRPLRVVGQPIRKKDAMQLVTGKPVYMDDIAPENCLIVKLLRSPHANAVVEEIDTSAARRIPGIAAVYTWEDVPQDSPRFTLAGQTYPELSPCDRLLIDRHVRFAGDTVAIVAGENEKCVDRALRAVRVKYRVLEPVLDFHQAKDNPVLVHPEKNWVSQVPCGADARRNLCASGCDEGGDLEGVLHACDVVIDRVFHTQACQQAMMETFRTFCRIDEAGRLEVVSSTQIIFHCRRIIANALGIPKSLIRVKKPRIGGGFGAKQSAISEIYPAFVTWKLKRPSKIIFTREESQTASSPRHEMEVHCRVGGMRDGRIRAIEVHTLSNTGAYGEHGPTTVGLSGHKSIPLYSHLDAFRFTYDVVYTNLMSAGAFRGYGAPQGTFAVESCISEFADRIGMDPIRLRLQNMVREGDLMPAYDGTVLTSCALDRCVGRVREMIQWNRKYPAYRTPDGKIRAVGIGMAMQGSGLAAVDVGSAAMKLNDGCFYTLRIGAADMGTGCDTTLAQIAAEVLECGAERVVTAPIDTDTSPYDSGSYASSTAYVTGKAVELCARRLREKITAFGAEKLKISAEDADFDGTSVFSVSDAGKRISLEEIATDSMCANNTALEASVTHSSPLSPPPFMAGAAEIEVDPETGGVKVLSFDACVDCGTPLNVNLARVQTEGGILQGIGMTLTEQVSYTPEGRMRENSFLQYRIPTRNDFGRIRVEILPSYEKSGPFGAKSIGEVVLTPPLPAITHALYNATGRWFRTLPVKPGDVAEACREKYGS